MNFKTVKAVLYITDQAVAVQSDKGVLKTIVFPEGLSVEKKLRDREALEQLLRDELAPLSKKVPTVVIVLGPSVLFQTSVSKKDEIEAAREVLLGSLPFSKDVASEKTIATPRKTYLLATNRDYYATLQAAAEKVGINVQAVLPLSLFSDVPDGEKLSKPDIKTILQKQSLYPAGDFLTEFVRENKEISQEEPQEVPDADFSPKEPILYEKTLTWNTSRLLLILGFLIILTILMGGLIYTQQMHQRRVSGEKVVTREREVTLTPTPTPVTEVAKSDLKVMVENGTGTPGQAGKVKDLLTESGYTSVETGNADTSDHTQTEVTFSLKVSSKQQQEIKDVLLKRFSAVTTRIDSEATNDIVVTTGEEK